MINPKDMQIFQSFISAHRQGQTTQETSGDVLLRTGRYFLGAPYEANTLNVSGPEGLVINLRSFDCFTLVESCCALTIMLYNEKDRFADYASILQSLRYRDGLIAGYHSRLHYFSDWLHNSEKRGVIHDITLSLGGMPDRKDVNFMAAHPGLYPPLQDPEACRQIIDIEKRLSDTSRHFLSKGEFNHKEGGIEEGDILAVTTAQEGLDICHVGIAVRLNGRLHLLHASQQAGQVIISSETFFDYLHQSPRRTGVMAARLALPRNDLG